MKFFVTSDIHSYYDELKLALDNAGFDEDNPEHYLVVLGDCFDRGEQSAEVLRFLRCLERRILVKGNHEQLLVECCERGYPHSYDYSNGTVKTIYDLGGAGLKLDLDECFTNTLARVSTFIDNMVNYFETKNYIFVHSWIPLKSLDDLPARYTRNRKFAFNPDWRNASQAEWDAAMWGNPFDLAEKGFNQTGKQIVFGHWNTSYLRRVHEIQPEWGPKANFDIYYGNNYIGIDGCVAHSGKCNVLVLEDEFLNG